MDNALLNAFAEHFQSLTESEQLQMGTLFNQKTGGKLSPYNNPNPVVIVLLPVDTPRGVCLVGVRRANEPAMGQVALPGGYMDENEEPHEAAAREVLEETGAKTDPGSYRFHDNPRAGKSNTLLCFMEYDTPMPYSEFERLSDELAENGDGECLEIVLIDPTTLLGFPLHQQVVSEFFD